MTYDWYKIFNLTEFNALGLTSKSYTYTLEVLGVKTILVTKGNEVSMLYDGAFLPIEFTNLNPFPMDGHAVYKATNNDIYLGIEVDES